MISEKIKRANVSIIFVDDKFILDLNKKYLKHNYTTDVISFNLEENSDLKGEIYISADTAEKNAGLYKVSLTNELIRLAIHGTLHLTGYEDDDESNRKQMTDLENKYLKI